MCCPDALLDFTWSVTGDFCGSDHYPILLSSADVLPLPRVPRWQLDHADWGLFKHLAIVDCEVDEFLEIDSAVEYFSSILQQADELSIPQTTGFTKRRPVTWWSDECRQAVTERRRTFGRYRRHKTEIFRGQYRLARLARLVETSRLIAVSPLHLSIPH